MEIEETSVHFPLECFYTVVESAPMFLLMREWTTDEAHDTGTMREALGYIFHLTDIWIELRWYE